MSVYGRIMLACLGSLSLLLGAFAFQFIGGFAPCPMCLWQRWPHAIAVVIGLLAVTLMWRYRRALSGVGFLAMAISAGLGVFHAGVEQLWWEGPTTCTGADPSSMNSDDLLNTLMNAPLVRCDEIVWDLWGITMAGWNAIISVGLALLWLFGALPKRPTRHVVPG